MTSSIASTASTAATGSTSSSAAIGQAAGMGKDDFMKLLIAQLQNQDPMKPTDDTQFIAQLAQFSSLEATNKMNDTMDEMAGAQLLGQAASMIGKQVSAKLQDGTVVTGAVTAVHMINSKPLVVVNGQEIDTSLINTVSNSDGTTTGAATSAASATTRNTAGKS
jgi:flagellar basal-body rod modification protein FlgD